MKTILTFFKTHILFFVFSFLALSFLIFQDGFWLYVDTAGWILNFDRYVSNLLGSFNSFSLGSFFGFDSSIISSSRLLQTILKILPMGWYYFIFFVCSYFSAFYLLKIFFTEKGSKYGALLYAFNPVSLYFLKQVGYLYAYFSLPFILLGIYYFFKTHKIKYLLLLVIGGVFMISYTRLTGIYILLFLFLAIYFHKFIFNILKKDKKSVILTLISSLSIISPFLFSLVFPYIDGNNNYFLGPQNYANHFAGFQDKLWERLSQKSMVYDFIPSEILHDFANNFQQGNIFIILGLIFIVGNSIYFLFSKKRKPLDTYVISILLFLIFFHGSAKFLNAEYFTSIIKYFPFITNNLDWLFIIYIPLLTYIFSYNLTHSKRKYIFTISLFIYIFISLFPLLNFPNNFKSQLVDINAMSEPYKKTFFTKNNDNPVSILYPQHTLHIKGNPYHIKISNNYNYILPFNKDSRLSGKKQSNLYDKANQYAYFPYYYLFNIKNIFVFKDIEEFDKKLDWYSGKNLKQKSEKKLQELYANDNLYIKQDNSSFTQFGFSYDGEYEYLLYAPNTILKKDINEMFSGTGKLDISQKIINIDTESFHKPQKIENFEIPEENRNLAIRYKKAYHQHTKIYAKFGNIDPKKPFIIQLNRTFGMSWKLKWISKKEFEEEKCIDAYKKFPVTQNVYCNYKPTIIDLADTKYLDYPKVKEENHFEGNFIGNTWLVEPDDIPENMKNNDVLYAVIIYEKQIWYNWFFVLSGGTFLLLILIALYQEVRSIFRKKKLLNK